MVLQIVQDIKLHGYKTKLQFAEKHLQLDGSLVWPIKAHCTGYFTGKVSWLPVNPQKLQNFSTSNDLQYTVSLAFPSNARKSNKS